MNAQHKKLDGEPWVMSAVLGLFRHPEWIRQGVYFVMLWGVITYGNFKVKSYVEGQKDELIRPITELRADVASIKQDMIKKREFRMFLKSWDKVHPELPATPMFDDIMSDSEAHYSGSPEREPWFAWIQMKYGVL